MHQNEILPGLLSGSPSPPLYKEVKLRLIEGLRAGVWIVGEPLPSEKQLAAHFRVSIGTLRKAVAELVTEGLLIRHQGRGTYVAPHNSHRAFHFFRIVPKEGIKELPNVALRSFRREAAPAVVQEKLGLRRGDEVFRIENILYLSSKPIVLDLLMIPVALFSGLTKSVFRDREGTIYGLYQLRYGINIIRTVERLSASAADSNVASALNVDISAPLLTINRTAFTFNNRAVEVRTRQVNTAEFDYISDLNRNEGAGDIS